MSLFTTTIQVRFGDVDPAGIVYFARIFDYIHDALEELFAGHVGIPYWHMLMERRVGFPLVHCDVDFRRPLRYGERPLVQVTCFRLGKSAIGLRYRFLVEDELRVEARMTTATIDMDTTKGIPTPEDVHRSIAELLEEKE